MSIRLFAPNSERLGEIALSLEDSSSLPYFGALSRTRRDFERVVSFFPRNACRLATRRVAEVTGLEEIAGYVPCHIHHPSRRVKDRWHACNHDPLRDLVVDITLDQFDAGFPRVAIYRPDQRVFYPLDLATTHQRQLPL